MIMDDPSASTTWERIGFFESPTLIAIIAGCVGALALFWIAAYFAKVRAGCERVLNWDEVAIVAASTAWILGFVFCGMFLMRGLTAQTPVEILHWYPSVPLVMGCWAFAAAGALSALAPLAIAASKKKAKHLAWQSAARYVTIAVFLTGTMAFWRLNLLGFSGW